MLVDGIDMTIGVENQFSAVFVILPFRNCFHVDPELDRSRDKHSLEGSLGNVDDQRQSQSIHPDSLYQPKTAEQHNRR
jgi:hypothetical protein